MSNPLALFQEVNPKYMCPCCRMHHLDMSVRSVLLVSVKAGQEEAEADTIDSLLRSEMEMTTWV